MERRVIIGTAGHVDHGKSVLVEVLTGRGMDRLAEERARGITIDLNFAPLQLGGGATAGVVDVPGHEDFVRTMVAGAAGMDLVLLVIAADEGIMPQTREHLAIVEALGVSDGIPVLTKCDLVEPEWLALVEEEVRTWLAGSPVQFGPPIPVSAVQGDGIAHLRAAIDAVAAATVPRDPSAAFRMPIDRAFSVPGAGTVVTGGVWSGSLESGAQPRLLPSGKPTRVRSIEMHGISTAQALAGHRTALGLAGIDRAEVRRGDVLVDDALPWVSTTAIDVMIHLMDEAPRPLTSRSRVHLHIGTAEVVARVLPRGELMPGDSGLARLVCDAPIVARGGDRFVIRSYSPVTTIGGGRVVDPAPPRRRAGWPGGLGASDPATHLHALLERHPPGVSSPQLAFLAGLSPEAVDALLAGNDRVVSSPRGWITAERLNRAREKALEVVSAYHREHPSLPGLSLETLRRGVDRSEVVAETAVARLVEEGTLEVESGVARRPGFEVKIAGGAAAVERVIDAILSAGLAAPGLPELERLLERVDVRGAVRIGAGAGRIEAVTPDWYVGRDALDQFRTVLIDSAQGGEVVLAQVRDRTGLTRKHLIPLLEWADRRGFSRRDGAVRRLT